MSAHAAARAGEEAAAAHEPFAVRLRGSIASLNPAWFAMVMATGIVGLAARAEGVRFVPEALLWLNVVLYGIVWLLYLARLALHPRGHLDDLCSHARAMGYFTLPAGTAVLGVQALVTGGSTDAGRGLWLATLAFWALLVYAVPVLLVTRREKPRVEDGLQGTWLVWIVATQGASILGTLVAPSFGAHAADVVLLTTVLWLLGGMFYLWVIQLIVRRMFFSELEAAQLSPTYWIDMGAVAISTLAGATLLQASGDYALTSRLEPFIGGLTLLFWATATWWIPWLVAMGVWRHVVRRHPLTFEPGYWGMVFPLGMYTVATQKTADALSLGPLDHIASGFVWVALAAWAATMLDLVVTPRLRRVS